MQFLPFLASGLAAAYVGPARTAFQYAFDYAHERVSWGKPIIEDQAVSLKLADMAADIEAAKPMVWKLVWAADRGDAEAAGVLSPAAKTMPGSAIPATAPTTYCGSRSSISCA